MFQKNQFVIKRKSFESNSDSIAVTFNMAHVSDIDQAPPDEQIVKDGAKYQAIGIIESVLQKELFRSDENELHSITKSLKWMQTWHYGAGQQARASQRIHCFGL